MQQLVYHVYGFFVQIVLWLSETPSRKHGWFVLHTKCTCILICLLLFLFQISAFTSTEVTLYTVASII